LAAAAIMVRGFVVVGISTGFAVGSCTSIQVLLEIIFIPNYMIIVFAAIDNCMYTALRSMQKTSWQGKALIIMFTFCLDRTITIIIL